MKLLKFIPLTLIIVLYNSNSFAVDCSSIKMNSSMNVIKKLQCKAGKDVSSDTSTTTEKSTDTSTTTEKKEGGWKIWKKPEWMKKKN